MNSPSTLQEILQYKPLMIGIGNDLRGDDGAGIELVRYVQNNGYENTLLVFGNPENYLYKIAAMPGEARLWVDIINWGGKPGDFSVFTQENIHHFAISTHNFSPSVLLEYLKTLRNIPDFFIGIQPLSINLGEGISEPVNRTIRQLGKFMIEILTK